MIRRVHVGAIVAIDHRKKRMSLRGPLLIDPWAVLTMPSAAVRLLDRGGHGWCGGLLLWEVLSLMLAGASMIDRGRA
ncbi:MAG TPA: hypothetical protein PK712_07135 [Rectinema sp.]|nr:hypothetical protein [Rectinema sp.]